MSDAIIVGIIAAIPGTLAAFAALRNGNKIDAGVKKVEAGNAVSEEIRVHTNGMSKRLEDAAFLAGAKSETDKE